MLGHFLIGCHFVVHLFLEVRIIRIDEVRIFGILNRHSRIVDLVYTLHVVVAVISISVRIPKHALFVELMARFLQLFPVLLHLRVFKFVGLRIEAPLVVDLI